MIDSAQIADELVTVVMPLYNKEGYVGDAIASVLDQSYGNFELIVINDGSTDSSVQVIERFQDCRITLVNQVNQGVSKARNSGVERARKNLVAFIDADDIWYRDHLKYLVQAFKKYHQAGLFCNRFVINKLKETIVERNVYVEYEECPNYAHSVVRGGPVVWTSAAMIRKDVFMRAGGFPENASHGEDVALWVKASRCAPIVFCSYIGAVYNQVQDGLTSKLVKCPDGAVDALNEIINSKDLDQKSRQDYMDMRASIALSHVMTAYKFGNKHVARDFLRLASGSKRHQKKYLLLMILGCAPGTMCRFATMGYIKIWHKLVKIREWCAH
jgi:glycosyltransferase involved in cell wall biosynthesis